MMKEIREMQRACVRLQPEIHLTIEDKINKMSKKESLKVKICLFPILCLDDHDIYCG